MITLANLLADGYKQHAAAASNGGATELLQKRIVDSKGTKYFVDFVEFSSAHKSHTASVASFSTSGHFYDDREDLQAIAQYIIKPASTINEVEELPIYYIFIKCYDPVENTFWYKEEITTKDKSSVKVGDYFTPDDGERLDCVCEKKDHA